MIVRISTYRLLLSLGIFAMAPVAALCQLNSGTASVTLTATLGEALTVAATPSAIHLYPYS